MKHALQDAAYEPVGEHGHISEMSCFIKRRPPHTHPVGSSAYDFSSSVACLVSDSWEECSRLYVSVIIKKREVVFSQKLHGRMDVDQTVQFGLDRRKQLYLPF